MNIIEVGSNALDADANLDDAVHNKCLHMRGKEISSLGLDLYIAKRVQTEVIPKEHKGGEFLPGDKYANLIS